MLFQGNSLEGGQIEKLKQKKSFLMQNCVIITSLISMCVKCRNGTTIQERYTILQ